MKINKKWSRVNIFISILLIISSFLSYYIFYINEENNFNLKMYNSEAYLPNSYRIVISGEIDKQDSKKNYKSIIETLDKYNGSIFYGRINEENKSHTEYIYDKSNKYTSFFLMKSGKTLSSEDMNSKKYTATYSTNDKLQIGVMSKFSKKGNMEIKTLKSMVDDGLNFSGTTYVAFKNPIDIKSFISELEKSLEVKGIQEIPKDNNINVIQGNMYIYVVIIIYFIVLLIILYQILKSYKKIAIKKLMGYSFKTLYLENALNILKINLIAGVLPLIFMSFYLFDNLNPYIFKFLLKFIGVVLIETGILLILSSLIYLYIRFISIPNMIKNKKPLTPIICLNYGIKIICLLALVFFLNVGINNTQRLTEFFSNSYENWDKMNGYMKIDSIQPKMDFRKMLKNKDYLERQEKIYKEFNKKGALLAEFSEYLPQIRAMRKSETNIYYERDNVMVNPNYLKMYKVYDENNLEIKVSDEDKDYILLIPEKYKKDEKNILKYLDSLKKRSFYALGENQETKIIWIKNDQKIFTISPEINPKEGNYIKNPLIQVITENNMLGSYYEFYLPINGRPLKIKPFNGLSGEETVRKVYKKIGMEKYLKLEVSRIDEQVRSQIESVKKNIKLSVLFSTALILTTILIIVQNSYNYVDKFKQKLAIKKLCGYKILDKHSNYLISIIIAWSIIFCVGILMYKMNFSRIFLITICGVFIETIISSISLIVIEKQKIVEVIKGE